MFRYPPLVQTSKGCVFPPEKPCASVSGIQRATIRPHRHTARIASSFGGGLGRLREVCGCVSGMAIVAGELLGYSGPETRKPKADHYVLIQELAEEFRKENGKSA